MRRFLVPGLLLSTCLAGCAQTPLGPTVVAMPGPGKTADAFQADQNACRQTAAQAVSGQAQAANASIVTGALTGALAGSTGSDVASGGAQANQAAQLGLQANYDNAYKDCIVAHNDLLPGMAPPEAVAEAPAPDMPVADPLVRHVQSQLVRLGYLHGGADGVAGPKTASAITNFEQDHHLTVDGVSSHSLLASLQAQEAPEEASAPTAKPAGWDVPPPAPAQ